MAELTPETPVSVRNFKTGNKLTIAYRRTQDLSYMRRNDLEVIDPRVTGEVPVAPPSPKKSAEQEIIELQKEMGITQPVDANADGIEVIEAPKSEKSLDEMDAKELKAEADKRGITYPKTAGKAQMLKLLK